MVNFLKTDLYKNTKSQYKISADKAIEQQMLFYRSSVLKKLIEINQYYYFKFKCINTIYICKILNVDHCKDANLESSSKHKKPKDRYYQISLFLRYDQLPQLNIQTSKISAIVDGFTLLEEQNNCSFSSDELFQTNNLLEIPERIFKHCIWDAQINSQTTLNKLVKSYISTSPRILTTVIIKCSKKIKILKLSIFKKYRTKFECQRLKRRNFTFKNVPESNFNLLVKNLLEMKSIPIGLTPMDRIIDNLDLVIGFNRAKFKLHTLTSSNKNWVVPFLEPEKITNLNTMNQDANSSISKLIEEPKIKQDTDNIDEVDSQTDKQSGFQENPLSHNISETIQEDFVDFSQPKRRVTLDSLIPLEELSQDGKMSINQVRDIYNQTGTDVLTKEQVCQSINLNPFKKVDKIYLTPLSEKILTRWDYEYQFEREYTSFMSRVEGGVPKTPIIGFVPINLFNMFKTVIQLGGYTKVTRDHKWKAVFFALNPRSEITNATTCTRRHYEKLLMKFEKYITAIYNNEVNFDDGLFDVNKYEKLLSDFDASGNNNMKNIIYQKGNFKTQNTLNYQPYPFFFAAPESKKITKLNYDPNIINSSSLNIGYDQQIYPFIDFKDPNLYNLGSIMPGINNQMEYDPCNVLLNQQYYPYQLMDSTNNCSNIEFQPQQNYISNQVYYPPVQETAIVNKNISPFDIPGFYHLDPSKRNPYDDQGNDIIKR